MYISEIIAALVATIFFYKYKHLPIKTILYILWIAVITEGMARVYSHYYHNNHWVYNLYAFLFYTLFYKMIYDHIKNKTRKRLVLVIATIMMTAVIIRGFTVPVITFYMSKTYSIAMVVMVFLLMIYAVERLKSDDSLRVKNELALFVFTAYLVFGISFIPLAPFLTGQMDFNYSRAMLDILRGVQTATLLFANALLVFGFIWTKPRAREVL